MFYGKYAFENSKILKPKQEFLVQRNKFYMFDFVAFALDDMLANYENGIRRNKIKLDDRYLSKPKIVAGYLDFNTYYAKLLGKYANLVNIYIKGRNLGPSIQSFEDYISVFMEYALERSNKIPFTKSSFMMSKDVSMLTTGLAVQIGDRDASVDQPKVDEFFLSPNFEYFRNSVINYGFLIDKNVPWRIVADLGSPQMSKYLERSQIGFDKNFVGPTSILGGYDVLAIDELDDIKQMLIRFYSSFVAQNPYYRKTVLGGYNCDSATSLIRRAPVNISRLQEDYQYDYWMPFYVTMKFYENYNNPDPATVDFVISNSLQILKHQGLSSALNYVQRKTFNISGIEGSLTYETRKFESKDLTEASVGDILEEVQQETLFEKFELF